MLRKAAANVAGTLGVSACIQLVMLPLSAYFYYEVPPYGIFANACVLPFMGVLLALEASSEAWFLSWVQPF